MKRSKDASTTRSRSACYLVGIKRKKGSLYNSQTREVRHRDEYNAEERVLMLILGKGSQSSRKSKWQGEHDVVYQTASFSI